MATSLEHLAELWPGDGRPRLIHLMPWDLTVGGAQRMLDVWCSHEAQRWDTHIFTVGARGPFGFAGATVHSELASSQILSLIETLQPDLLVHHDPTDKNGISSTVSSSLDLALHEFSARAAATTCGAGNGVLKF